MHLVFMIEGSGIGGNETSLKTLAPFLKKRHRLSLICPPGPAKNFLKHSFHSVWSPAQKWKDWDRLMVRVKADRVIAIHGDIVALAAACRRLGVPVDWWCGHSMDPSLRARWQAVGETLFDRVLFPSKFLKQQLNVSNSALLPGIVDVKRFKLKKNRGRKRLKIPCNAFVIGYCGRFVPSKRHEELLDVLNLLPDNFFTLLIGNAHRSDEKRLLMRLKKRIQARGMNARCLSVSDKALPQALSAMDVFVSPSVNEGFGSSVLEAMSVGIPVVAACSGGPAETLKQLPHPFLYAPGNLAELSVILLRLWKEKSLRTQAGREGRKLMTQKFHPRLWFKALTLGIPGPRC